MNKHLFYEVETGEYEFYEGFDGVWCLFYNDGYNDKFNKFIGKFATEKECVRYCRTHKTIR